MNCTSYGIGSLDFVMLFMKAAICSYMFNMFVIAVSRFTGTDRNGPERTETDRNGPKRTFVDTETDSPSTETDSLGTETDRNGPKRTATDFRGYRNGLSEYRNALSGYRNGPKRTFLNTETDSLGTES